MEATVARIKNGDREGWVREWLALAERVAAAGDAAAEAGHTVSAVGYLRRGATYYSTALYAIAGTKAAEDKLEVWRQGRKCWDRVLALVGGERLSIPYEDTTLPGYFFAAPESSPEERRPLMVINNGSDGATSSM